MPSSERADAPARYEGDFDRNDMHGEGEYSWNDGRGQSCSHRRLYDPCFVVLVVVVAVVGGVVGTISLFVSFIVSPYLLLVVIMNAYVMLRRRRESRLSSCPCRWLRHRCRVMRVHANDARRHARTCKGTETWCQCRHKWSARLLRAVEPQRHGPEWQDLPTRHTDLIAIGDLTRLSFRTRTQARAHTHKHICTHTHRATNYHDLCYLRRSCHSDYRESS